MSLGWEQNLVSRIEPNGSTSIWAVERLWEHARDLPVQQCAVHTLQHLLDDPVWFPDGEREPTVKAVAEHAERILSADLEFPVILAANGDILDGMHRLAKTWMLGVESIKTVQFTEDPAPDWVEEPGM